MAASYHLKSRWIVFAHPIAVEQRLLNAPRINFDLETTPFELGSIGDRLSRFSHLRLRRMPYWQTAFVRPARGALALVSTASHKTPAFVPIDTPRARTIC